MLCQKERWVWGDQKITFRTIVTSAGCWTLEQGTPISSSSFHVSKFGQNRLERKNTHTKMTNMYHLVMTNSSPWKITMFLITVNHLFQ